MISAVNQLGSLPTLHNPGATTGRILCAQGALQMADEFRSEETSASGLSRLTGAGNSSRLPSTLAPSATPINKSGFDTSRSRVVVLISANAEWRVVKPLFPDADIQRSPFGEYFESTFNRQPVTFFHGGWGKISAAATAQYAIDHFSPDLLVNLGTCGGFEGCIERGAIILVEKTIVYDIIAQMTDGVEEDPLYTTDLDLSWLGDWESKIGRRDPSVVRGLLVSGDRDIVVEDIPDLIKKFGAVAADWESASIAWVATRNGTRLIILRGVSDLVSAKGGEAYGNYDLFIQRTGEIMKRLIDQLPDWLGAMNP